MALNVAERTGESKMEAGRQTNANGMEIATLEQFGNVLERFVDTEPSDPGFQAVIIDFSKLLKVLSDSLFGFKDEELNRNSRMIANMSSKYKNDPELSQKIADWCESRKELIKITNLCADELDQNSFVVYLSQMVGLFIEILSSLNFGILQILSSTIVSYASKYWPTLGLVIECALPLVPYLKYTGIVSSFIENWRSEVLIRRVVKAMQVDKEKLLPIKQWFDETSEFEDSVKKLFPYEIDENIIETIEKYLNDLGEERKIFATAVLFAAKKNPSLPRNGKIVGKIILFCKSQAAKEWYQRLVMGASPLNLESSMIHFHSEMQHMEELDAKPGLALEIGRYTLPIESILPRLLLCSMNGMSIYTCYKRIKAGSKHRYSIGLRELVKNAESFLYNMKNIHRRRSSRVC